VYSKNKTPVSGSSIPVLGVNTETGVVLIWLFSKIDLCSATSFKSAFQDLLNDVADHRSILKNYQNTFYTRFGIRSKTGLEFPKTGGLLLLYRGANIISLTNREIAYLVPRSVVARIGHKVLK